MGLLGDSDSKESTCKAGDLSLIPGLERSPREGNGNPLQYSCLENPMDREDWRATVHEVTKSRTQLTHTQHPTSLYILSEFYYYISGLWEIPFFKRYFKKIIQLDILFKENV